MVCPYQRELLCRAGAQQVALVRIEPIGEHHVEAHEKSGDGGGDDRDDREQQSPADPERSHRRR